MTTSAIAERSAEPLRGSQEPRLRIVPPHHSSSGAEVVELCATFGLYLDPWQEQAIDDALCERVDCLWAATSVCLIVPRQNGKTEILIARILAGLFLFGEREIIYSAHRADTSMKIFQRFVRYLRNNPTTRALIDAKKIKINNTHGQEGVTFDDGRTVGFRTRAQEGGRGFSAECVIFDEAFEISDELHAAVLPTILAMGNPQLWYVGTPVDQMVHRNGVVFASVRDSALAGEEDTVLLEWSIDASIDDYDRAILDDPSIWALVNPAMGYRITERTVGLLRRRFRHKPRKFVVECLGIGDWPRTDEAAMHVIDLDRWDACEDDRSKIDGATFFAFDASPGLVSAAIAVGGFRADGLPHIEVTEHRRGTRWLAKELKRLRDRHSPTLIVFDPNGPAGALAADVETELDLGPDDDLLHRMTAREHADAFGMFCSAVEENEEPEDKPERGRLRHLGTEELRTALEGASTRVLGDGGQAWSRRNSEVDICPLVACTQALWAAHSIEELPEPWVDFD